jgi:hypothetical protein
MGYGLGPFYFLLKGMPSEIKFSPLDCFIMLVTDSHSVANQQDCNEGQGDW